MFRTKAATKHFYNQAQNDEKFAKAKDSGTNWPGRCYLTTRALKMRLRPFRPLEPNPKGFALHLTLWSSKDITAEPT